MTLPTLFHLTTRNRLRVKPMWHNGLRCGQAFFDPHEGTVEYHVVPHDRYHSYIDCGPVRIDLAEDGAPVLVEVDIRTSKLNLDNTLSVGNPTMLCRHRFLDFPIQHDQPSVTVNCDNSLLYIRFSRTNPAASWAFAPGAIWEVDADSCVVGLFLISPLSDPSGQLRAKWRLSTWRAYRRGRLEELAAVSSMPERGWLSLPKIFP